MLFTSSAETSLLVVAFLCTYFTICAADSKPIMVIDLFRHGARGIYEGRWDPLHIWNNTFQELTNAGMRMHYLLGKSLAQDYSHLLGTYNPSQISVYSTDTNRTIMSAYSHLFGMFSSQSAPLTDYQCKTAVPPGLENYNISEFIKDQFPLPKGIQPIPVHIIDRKRDYALSADKGCTNFQKVIENSSNTSAFAEFKTIANATLNMIKQEADKLNLTINDIWDYWSFADSLNVNYYENRSLLINVTYASKEWSDLMFVLEWTLTYLYTGELKNLQLMGFNLFERMFSQLNGKLNGTFNKTFAILSAHETTLVPMLVTLGIVTPDCLRDVYLGKTNDSLCRYPDFSASVITELYNDTEKPYVKFKYNGIYVNVCNTTDNSCPLEAYQQLVNQRMQGYNFSSWLNDCGISSEIKPTPSPQPQPTPKPSDDSDGSNSVLIIMVVAVGIVCMIELGVLVSLLRKGKRKSLLDQKNESSLISLA